jgi:SNF2 family DNA or RNA helicase
MKYKPHKYQQYAIEFIKQHPIAAILLDLGMGKTSIVLSCLNYLMSETFEVSKVLIIAPLRVARNTWSDEIKKWDHLQGLRYSIAVGTAAERIKALKADADIYIINRENVPWLIEESGLPFDYDMVVVDELSSFKNWNAKRFKALMKVRPKVKRIVGLTGTPSSNGLMDLFAEFKVLDMGERLGRFISQYRVNFFKPDRVNGPIVYSYKLLPGAEDRIYEKISDITISMKASDYLEMPELISTEYKVYLDDEERAKYEELKNELVLQLPGAEITAANAATLSGKLSQLANGAIYDDDGSVNAFHERKLDALEDLIESANGKPVLVAYWFKHDLKRITERLTALKVNFQRLDSDESIRKWNAGELQVGLIHPASAGHGLNLQEGGNTIIWFGITWSLELYSQTIGRLFRQGQKAKNVTVIHIITDGTVDERILKALEAKDSTQRALIDAVKAEVVMDGS